jgi:hypothetical protein
VQGIAITTTRRIAIAASSLPIPAGGLLVSPRTHVSNDKYSTDPATRDRSLGWPGPEDPDY